MTDIISHYWERRGSAIYTEGRFNGSEYVEGSAELVMNFNDQVHIDHIDYLVNFHNEALDKHADDKIEEPDDWFGF